MSKLRSTATSASKLPLIIATVAVVAIAGVLFGTRTAGAARHPDPRPGVTGERVLPASSFGDYDQLVRAYTAARMLPEVMDGLYCYCQCKENFGHVSLLTCFESEHGASCDICVGEALLAARMHGEGATLEQIRRAIDAQYRS